MPTKAKRTTAATTAPAADPLHTLKIEHHSACQHPYPVCIAPATVVDYVVSPTDGGRNDWHNLISLCTAHHDLRHPEGVGDASR